MKKTSGKTNPPGFGWMRNLPDKRDHLYPLPLAKLRAFPSQVDLRRHCQCHRRSDRVRSEEEKLAYFTRSRFLFIITSEKLITARRSMMAHRSKLDASFETEWPCDETSLYIISHFSLRTQLPTALYV